MIERLLFGLVATLLVSLDVACIATLSVPAAVVLAALILAYVVAWLWWR